MHGACLKGTEALFTGQAIYTSRCSICHAEHAHGNDTTSRLVGQQIGYLKKSIRRYRDRTGERIYEPMSASTAGLKEAEIQELATYLSSLKYARLRQLRMQVSDAARPPPTA
ncbi:c-type cytochrome [Undibacterium sp. Tian12W]|uniref:c-type cytochrome n=1 Tax=Undibacterium sp. Tian12W TaxID=3413054 RepID=UPI003BEFC5D2